MRRVEGKVALVTGAARGQGRAHALRLAEEGAKVVAIDRCADVETAPYSLSTSADLEETQALIEALGAEAHIYEVDVRDSHALHEALATSVAKLGRLDIVSANAGIISYGTLDSLSEETWNDVLDINLTGVWKTCKAAIPHIRAGGRGGSIHVTSSALGLIVSPNIGHYASAKHGLTALVRTLAIELGPESIRVNAIHPGAVNTPLIHNQETYNLFRPDLDSPNRADFEEACIPLSPLRIPYVEPIDISNALLFLASDEARYITGATLSVDGGTAIA
ncbi:mycofactocin-coupled SDR family oxidoreductase [Rhodococcus sp. USK13]|uniref:mycofactocin-coupled SDR family oxidoreductase n=1 Tax=Rhodococcus sp. USK13 TaxID=2806442 RepID=UPI001BD14474|nr:mycofactocin-coupled SDR family oxidoreductase [Rhodococcus sp. USK13]